MRYDTGETVLSGLTQRTRRLHDLLEDPHPGLFTWQEALYRSVNDLVDWWCDEGEYAPSDDEPTEAQLRHIAELHPKP